MPVTRRPRRRPAPAAEPDMIREPREPMRRSQQYLDPSVERRKTIRRHGWPMTKAGYVRAMFEGRIPEFPPDGEVEAQVPDALPGPMPTSARDLRFARSKDRPPPSVPFPKL